MIAMKFKVPPLKKTFENLPENTARVFLTDTLCAAMATFIIPYGGKARKKPLSLLPNSY